MANPPSGMAVATKILFDNAGVKGVVSNRIYPFVVPQNATFPLLILNIVGSSDDQLLGGAAGYFQTRIQVDCVSSKATEANHLGEYVMRALGNVVKASIAGAVDVDAWFANTDVSDYSDNLESKRRTLDFYIKWRAPAPAP